jgi:hypothetical protein
MERNPRIIVGYNEVIALITEVRTVRSSLNVEGPCHHKKPFYTIRIPHSRSRLLLPEAATVGKSCLDSVDESAEWTENGSARKSGPGYQPQTFAQRPEACRDGVLNHPSHPRPIPHDNYAAKSC